MNNTDSTYKSILVIDDHKMLVNGIKLVAGRLFENFHMAHDGASGMSLALRYFPELIVVDFYLPDMPGDSLVRQLKEKLPTTRIMAYSFSDTPDSIIKMLKAGIDGYTIKQGDDEEFVKAIHLLMRGREYFCREARIHIVNRFSTATDDFSIKHIIGNTKLSGKEIELIRLLCKQMTTREIGYNLNLSERTVEQYRSNIMRKVNAKTLAGVIKFAIQNGLILVEDL